VDNSRVAKVSSPKSGPVRPAVMSQPVRSHKAVLLEYFTKVNPSKMGNIDKLLWSYKGKEKELYKKLEQKYGQPVILDSSPGD